jgi:hypothetical protein
MQCITTAAFHRSTTTYYTMIHIQTILINSIQIDATKTNTQQINKLLFPHRATYSHKH